MGVAFEPEGVGVADLTSHSVRTAHPGLKVHTFHQIQQISHSPHGYSVIGLSHNTADLVLRGRLAFTPESARAFLACAMESGLGPCLLLSTCNRTELYFLGNRFETAVQLLSSQSGVPVSEFIDSLYCFAAAEVPRHLFRVIAGLNSVAIGETEIVQQIKDSLRIARESGALTASMPALESGGSWNRLEFLLLKALEANKIIRSESELNLAATSLPYLFTRQIEKVYGSIQESRVLLLGVGKIAKRVAEEVLPRLPKSFVVINRTSSHAEEFASEIGAASASLEDLPFWIERSDIIFSAASGSGYLIRPEHLTGIEVGASKIFADLGVPPTIDPEIASDGNQLIDLDDINEIAIENARRKEQSVERALNLVDERVEEFVSAVRLRTLNPVIKEITDRAEEIRQRNLTFALAQLPTLSDRELKIIESLSIAIARGFTEEPISRLKLIVSATEGPICTGEPRDPAATPTTTDLEEGGIREAIRAIRLLLGN